MHTLLNFFIKHNHWFLFLLLEGIGVMLIVQFNNYQNAKMFTSANSVAGNLFAAITDVSSYFALKSENARLLEYNKELNEQVTALQAHLAQQEDSATVAALPHKANGFFYNCATVVNNSLNAVNNYITIDKGTADGVEAEMGVFCNKGVVGIIYTASEHYSVVIPLLNSKSSISCRVKGSDSFCTLQWDGSDTRYSYLVDLPRYTKFEVGDTVVTSGFSSIFPADIPVGIIERTEDSDDGMFAQARVELFTDFATLRKVYTVGNEGRKEQWELENSISKE
ncbi:MAG: rod shape-determining protein MreC [Bacteroidaceae bacterium]|nr:rod shape-determining protein MreC [Bacteroidaceae bacterium]